VGNMLKTGTRVSGTEHFIKKIFFYLIAVGLWNAVQIFIDHMAPPAGPFKIICNAVQAETVDIAKVDISPIAPGQKLVVEKYILLFVILKHFKGTGLVADQTAGTNFIHHIARRHHRITF